MTTTDAQKAQAGVDLGTLGTFITAMIGALASILGGVATIGGGVDALVREQGTILFIACAFVGLGSLLAAFYLLFLRGVPKFRPVLFVIGVLYALAVLTVLGAALLAASHENAPTVTAALVTTDSGEVSVRGSVDTRGLRSTDLLRLRIDGVRIGGETFPIESSSSGGNVDGTAHIAFDTRVDPRLYTQVRVSAWVGTRLPAFDTDGGCPSGERSSDVGCSMQVLPFLDPLQLDASLKGTGSDRVLTVQIDAPRVSELLQIVVREKPTGADWVLLYSGVLPAGPTGSVHRTLELPLPDPRGGDVCIVAITFEPSLLPVPSEPSVVNGPLPLLPCPPPNRVYPWIQMRIPSLEIPVPSGG